MQQFKTEADAKSHCGTDQVVWGNTSSHALHAPGTKYYGKTMHGAYMCKGLQSMQAITSRRNRERRSPGCVVTLRQGATVRHPLAQAMAVLSCDQSVAATDDGAGPR